MNMNGVYPAPGYSQQIPYQASYGYNPYGNQQRIEQPQNYFQPAQTQQIQQTQMTPIGINGKIVPSVENITANDVPMDGSVAFFPKQDMSEIYAKSWNSDGTIRTIVFKPVLNDMTNNLSHETEKMKFDLSDECTGAFMGKFDELFGKIEQLEERIGKIPVPIRMNLMQMILNQMINSPQMQNNPMAKNAMQMYQSGDTVGLKTMAENLCKERGITVDEAKQKVMSMFNH